MSADRWDPCPICHNLPAEWRNGIDYLYRIVSKEEFEKSEAEYNKLKDKETVREDWDIGVNEDGTADVSFSAKCQNCGATWTIDTKVSAEIKKENGADE